jgi:hypothetical protein
MQIARRPNKIDHAALPPARLNRPLIQLMVENSITNSDYAVTGGSSDARRQKPDIGDLSPAPINCSTESWDWPDSCRQTRVVSLRYSVQKADSAGGSVVGDLMREIREIYQSWLDGDLSQEDALFAIGDLLERVGEPAVAEPVTDHPSATRKQGS